MRGPGATEWDRDPTAFANLTSYDGPSLVEVMAPGQEEEFDHHELGHRVRDAFSSEAADREMAEIEEALASESPGDLA